MGFALAAGLYCWPAAAAPAGPDDFRELVRQLLILQDDAARGVAGSVARQRDLLAEIAARREELLRAITPTRRNASAMLAYVLGGGHPAVAEKFARYDGLDSHYALIIEAAALFMRGKKTEAAAKLNRAETKAAAPDAGRIALMQAMLLPDTDPRKLPLLRQAIAALPGSLIEEAALRRAVYSAAAAGHAVDMTEFADRYVRRFPDSLFAPEFLDGYAKLLAELNAKQVDVGFPRLQATLDRMPQARRLAFYLVLADAAVATKQPALAQFAASRARRLARPGSPELLKADLLDLAFEIASPDGAAAASRLERLQPSSLQGDDRRLMLAALAVAAAIRSPSPPLRGFTPDDAQFPSFVALRTRARAVLSSAETLLAEAQAR